MTWRRRSSSTPHDHLAAAPPSTDGTPTDGCDQCIRWELRYLVAVRASYYVSLHIKQPELRETVLNHIAAAWAHCIRRGSHTKGFHAFFTAYRADVERDVDPHLRNTPAHPTEYRRIWTNHAHALRGQLTQIQPRETIAS
jgi:hypothetical protein